MSTARRIASGEESAAATHHPAPPESTSIEGFALTSPAGYYVLVSALCLARPGWAVMRGLPLSHPLIGAAVLDVDRGAPGAAEHVRAFFSGRGAGAYMSSRDPQRIADMKRWLGGRLPGQTELERRMRDRARETVVALPGGPGEYAVSYAGREGEDPYPVGTFSGVRQAEAAVYVAAAERALRGRPDFGPEAFAVRSLTADGPGHPLQTADLLSARLGFAPHRGAPGPYAPDEAEG